MTKLFVPFGSPLQESGGEAPVLVLISLQTYVLGSVPSSLKPLLETVNLPSEDLITFSKVPPPPPLPVG